MKNRKETLEDVADNSLREDNAQSEAVRSLLTVKPRLHGDLATDIELKTELTDAQTCLHTQGNLLGHIWELNEGNFTEKNLIQELVDLKERKLVSLKRQSRREIVDVARNPDMSIQGEEHRDSFVKRFFKGKNKNQQQR